MGRTQRKRTKSHQRSQALNHEETVINLRKFMSRNEFNDAIKLKLCHFPTTGRGVITSKALKENDIIITVPFKLMINYCTLQKSNFLTLFNPHAKLTIHDLLAAFLVVQRQKSDSFWKEYIDSLPPKPPWIPAFLSKDHVELLPVDLRLAVKQTRTLLEASWSRLKKSIRREVSCVIDLHSFVWGYVLVNTRAVYVNPRIIRKLCDCESDILSDEPCMALCPFLDMFNHSHEAKTKAELIDDKGKANFKLTTLVKVKKHEQVFISYGDHDNVKLLMEYGFFIPGNWYDSVPIQSVDVFKVLKLNVDDLRYKFICRHNLDKELYISDTGASFNLKAILFIACGIRDLTNLASVIYTDTYPKDFLKNDLVLMCQKLLYFYLQQVEHILQKFENPGPGCLIDYLRYRKLFIEKLVLINKQ